MEGTVNGRVRKTLAHQIDRLDGILDGLAEGLHEAVADAVKAAVVVAVREAVEATLREVLARPEIGGLLARCAAPEGAPVEIASPAPAPSAARPGTTRRAWAGGPIGRVVARIAGSVVAVTRRTGQVLVALASSGLARLRRFAGAVGRAGTVVSGLAGLAWRSRRPVAAVLAGGVATGLACHLAGPVAVAVVAGLLGGAATAAALALGSLWGLLACPGLDS